MMKSLLTFALSFGLLYAPAIVFAQEGLSPTQPLPDASIVPETAVPAATSVAPVPPLSAEGSPLPLAAPSTLGPGMTPPVMNTLQEHMAAVTSDPIEKEIFKQVTYLRPSVNINSIPSLFFTRWEHDLIIDARRGKVTSAVGGGSSSLAGDPGIREVTLGGIVFVSPKDWTIWLNNNRVTPTAIPEQVMDLKVYKTHIDLEWFDIANNKIYPIRLRPHQRFNIDARMFLPE